MYIYLSTFLKATFPGVTYHLIPTLRSKNQLTHFSWKTTLPLSPPFGTLRKHVKGGSGEREGDYI